ncbi:hypothetical protein C3Y92_09535 [Solidesulfovibrio carbinolicus]|uniref:Glycosyltransferase RgtA/B/C/D-like domain-containing protein n=2 Tax=Solidesulfovibrio carbinolicus TaxID=296842 RepID=A0A4P6HN56_9BACT|nr:hypothetical protein C3Y92_09535 [Solidesulfovibrio carbinolicus]
MQDYPFLVTLYTPIYHCLAAVIALFALGNNVVSAGHLVSYFGWLMLLIVMVWIIRRQTQNLFFALTVPLAFATSPYLTGYILHIRPDLLAWCLAFAAVGLFATRNQADNTSWPVATALILTAALFTKQQTMAVCCGLATAFVVKGIRFKTCLRLTLLVGGASVVLALALHWATGGTFLMHTVWYPAKLAADPSVTNLANAWPRLLSFVRAYLGLILVSLLALADGLRRGKLHLFDWLALVHLPFLVKLVSTWGADNNYFIGMLIILTLRAGVFLADLATTMPAWRRAMAYALLLALLPLNQLPWDRTKSTFPTAMPNEVEALLEEAGEGPILINAEGAAPFLASLGKQLRFFDGTETRFFEQVGLWSFHRSRMAADIVSRQFSAIVLTPTFLDPEVVRFVNSTYFLSKKLSNCSIYRPRPGNQYLLTEPGGQIESVRPYLAVSLVSSSGLQAGNEFGARFMGRAEKSERGTIIYAVTAEKSVQIARLTIYPKVPNLGSDSWVEAAWSSDGVLYHPFLRYEGSVSDNSTALFEPRLEGSFTPKSAEFTIRLTLFGSARLWTGDNTPMLLSLE